MLSCHVRDHYQERLAALGIRALRLPGAVKIHPKTAFEPPGYLGGSLNLATHVSIGAFTLINGGRINGVTMGRYCSIAGDVSFGGAEHPMDRVTSSAMTYSPGFHGWDTFYDESRAELFRKKVVPFEQGRRLTVLGHDVWIGLGAIIKAGVSIGTGAVIGAGAVVTRDVPPYAIVTGTPATIRRYRFQQKTIEKLLYSRWWDYALYDVMSENITDPDAFCDTLQELVATKSIKPYAPALLDASRLCGVLEGTPEQG